jgi:hypothetical protein
MPDPAPAPKPETAVALIRVVDDQGACFASVFGVTATRAEHGWSFPVAKIDSIIAAVKDGRKMVVTLTDPKGKKTHWSGSVGTAVNLDGESVVLALKKA